MDIFRQIRFVFPWTENVCCLYLPIKTAWHSYQKRGLQILKLCSEKISRHSTLTTNTVLSFLAFSRFPARESFGVLTANAFWNNPTEVLLSEGNSPRQQLILSGRCLYSHVTGIFNVCTFLVIPARGFLNVKIHLVRVDKIYPPASKQAKYRQVSSRQLTPLFTL